MAKSASDLEQERLGAYRSARSAAGLQTDLTDRNVLDSAEFNSWGGGAFAPTAPSTPPSMQALDSSMGGAMMPMPTMPGMSSLSTPSVVPPTAPASAASESSAKSLSLGGGGGSSLGGLLADSPADPAPQMTSMGVLRGLGRRTPSIDSMALAGLGRKVY